MRNENHITGGIDSSIARALDKAIEKNSKESYLVLEHFVRSVLQTSTQNNSINHFQQYIFFPVLYYGVSYAHAQKNPALLALHKLCSERAPRQLKEILSYDLSLFGIKPQIQQRKQHNIFYYWAFNSFSNLLYTISKNNDLATFKHAMNQFEDTDDISYERNYRLKFRIRDLKDQNTEESRTELNRLREEYQIFEQFNTYKRQVSTTIRYWIFLLFSKEIFDVDTTLAFLKSFASSRSDAEDTLSDILFFVSNKSTFYMTWQQWEYQERIEGKFQSSTDFYEWVTLGFMADQIREGNLYVNVNDLDERELSSAYALYERLKVHAIYFQDNFKKWKSMLNVKTEEDLKARCDGIIELFTKLKNKTLGEKDRIIAESPLNEEQVNNFKEGIGKIWISQARIHRLFIQKNNREDVTGNLTELKFIGRKIFFEKAKMMFIDGRWSQQIFGIDSLGGEIGRSVDNFFFSEVFKQSVNIENGASAFEVIDKLIKTLIIREISPDLILLSPEYSYKDEKLLGSDRFVLKRYVSSEGNDLSFFLLGWFDNIPIYTSFSILLNNKVLVCNFEQSFKMLYKTNPDWFKNELKVVVTEVSDVEAQKRLSENPTKWKNMEDGTILSDEDALILIKTSVILEIGSILDFRILNKEAYVIGNIISTSEIS